MDIISFIQSKKAQKKSTEMYKKLGHTDAYKNGPLDIKGTYPDADRRLDAIESRIQQNKPNKRVDDLSAYTMINLNKYNLKVSSYLLAKKYRHANMVFDDFTDTSNIVPSENSNLIYDIDNGVIKQDDLTKEGKLVLKEEVLSKSFQKIIISLSVKNKATTDELEPVDVVYPDVYLTTNSGGAWRAMKVDEINEMVVESSKFQIQINLRDGDEVYAISYSWE